MSHNFWRGHTYSVSKDILSKSFSVVTQTSQNQQLHIKNDLQFSFTVSVHVVSMTYRGVHLQQSKKKKCIFTYPNLCLCQVAHPPKQLLQRKIFLNSNHNQCQKCLFHQERVHCPTALHFFQDPVTVFSHFATALRQGFRFLSGQHK